MSSDVRRCYRPVIPEAFKTYNCADYFESRFIDGFYDEQAHLTIILPVDQLSERSDLHFLVVGRPGVDGIKWGYRQGHSGLWAYYPISRRFEFLAPTVTALFDGWYSGQITA